MKFILLVLLLVANPPYKFIRVKGVWYQVKGTKMIEVKHVPRNFCPKEVLYELQVGDEKILVDKYGNQLTVAQALNCDRPKS